MGKSMINGRQQYSLREIPNEVYGTGGGSRRPSKKRQSGRVATGRWRVSYSGSMDKL